MPDPASGPGCKDRSCDILLVQPPIQDYYLTSKRTIPYGLLSIAALLEKKGYRVDVLDGLANRKSRPVPLPPPLAYLGNVYGTADVSPFALFYQYRHFGYALSTIGEQARRSGAKLIGISSLFSAYEDMALECARVVKTNCPGALVVLGGHHPTAFPDRVLEHPSVDFVLRGDGEVGMPLLAAALTDGGDLETIPGIAFDRQDGSRHVSPPAYHHDLENLPPPAIDHLSSGHYARKRKDTIVIVASRGCPQQCSYCCMGAGSRIPYRRRSVASVMQEVYSAIDSGREIGFIDFEDENIAMHRAWFSTLLREIIRHFGGKPPELRAMNGLYPPTLDKPLIAQMQEAGFRELNLSLGSSDQGQCRRFRRPAVTEAFERILHWAESCGMTAVGYIIAGAPDQNPITTVNDLLFLASRRVLAGLSIFYPAPGSADFAYCQKRGILPSSPLRWRSTALPIDHTTRRLESLTLLRLARLLNFMKNRVDETGELPQPELIPNNIDMLSGSRREIGQQLLRWFLADNIIRGVTRKGRIITHPSSARLTHAFRKGLETVGVQGVRNLSN